MRSTAHIRRPFDPADPPEGVRLELANVAGRIGLSMRSLGIAAGIGKSTMFYLATENRWPVRADQDQIRTRLLELLRAHGATEEELATAFHAHVTVRAAARRETTQRMGSRYVNPLLPGSEDPAPAPTLPRRDARAALDQPKETDVLLPRQTLSMEARKAFALFTNPFDAAVASDEQMYTNAEIAFVREACWQAAIGGRFVAVVSESGGGKTTILQDLEARIERDKKPVIVIRPSVLGMEDSDRRGYQVKATDILAAIITTLQPGATVPQTMEARSKRAAKYLADSVGAGMQHLLVIEEAHCLPEATLKHLKRLHELHIGRRPLLGILLVAQPELMVKLDPKKASLREVTQRCEVVQLLPLDSDLKAYLAHRAASAGRRLEEFITDDGVEAIRARLTVEVQGTGGKARRVSLVYPLAVNNWMTAALNQAAEIGVPKVSRDVVLAV